MALAARAASGDEGETEHESAPPGSGWMSGSGHGIGSCALPPGALLLRLREAGAYTDCYGVTVDGQVTHAQFVAAFYTTWVFKLERAILALAVAKPSTDAQALALARGETDAFAVWTVEARAPDQLLLCDYRGRTRSWLMREPAVGGGTRLYFGSAVVPVADAHGQRSPGGGFSALLAFHKLYSRVLLRAAVQRLL
jgi:hypothetical protein